MRRPEGNGIGHCVCSMVVAFEGAGAHHHTALQRCTSGYITSDSDSLHDAKHTTLNGVGHHPLTIEHHFWGSFLLELKKTSVLGAGLIFIGVLAIGFCWHYTVH